MLTITGKIIKKIKNTFFIVYIFFYYTARLEIKFIFFFKKIYQFSLKQEWEKLKKLYHTNYHVKYYDGKNLQEFKEIYFKKLDQYKLFTCYIFSRIDKNFKTQSKIKNLLKKKIGIFPDNKKLFEFSKKKNLQIYKLNFFKKIDEKKITDFKSFVKNKTIAVVGPRDSNIKRGKIIDNYDIVVRTNFFKNSNFPYDIYGKKTSISYYNSYRVQLKKNKILEVADNLEWLVFKSKNDLLKIYNYNLKNKLRVSNLLDDFFFFSYPMSPQLIVNDLLMYEAREIKLFHFDFYYKDKYNSFYKNFGNSKNHIANSLRLHGAVDCFLYLKKIYQNNLIKIDKKSCLLDLKLNQYINGIDKLYGKIKYSYEY